MDETHPSQTFNVSEEFKTGRIAKLYRLKNGQDKIKQKSHVIPDP